MKRAFVAGVLFLLGVNLALGQTNRQVDNAIAFARLYGYVKYFHPSDEAAGIDWERFAIYGARQVENCKNTQELQTTLTTLFQPIAPAVQIYTGKQAPFSKNILTPANTADYKIITWQHEGVKVGDVSNVYKSARTNRGTSKTVKEDGFGSVSKMLDATPYRNKEFIFRACVKMGTGNGTGHLWARVDKPDKKVGYFNNMANRPIRSKEWQDYEITGTVDADAQTLFIGAFLRNPGELWLDNLSVQVKEENKWQEVYANSFEEEQLGKAPTSLTRGVLTYNYQIVPSAESNTQKCLVIKRENNPTVDMPAMLLFPQYATIGEYSDKAIGNGLRATIPLALYGTSEQTYPAADKLKLEQLQKALLAIPAEEITGNNLYVRLANLAITWNIFQHFYPYFDIAKTNWQQDLETAIRSAYIDKTEADFLSTLQKLTAKLKDGHVRVSAKSVMQNYAPPITWEWVENQLIITNNLDKAVPVTVGDIVTSINGEKPEKYFDKLHQHISAATKGYLNYRARHEALLGEQGSTLTIKIKKADKSTAEIVLKRESPIYQVLGALPKPDTIKQLSTGIMYINVGQTSMESIREAMPQLQQSKAIICDLRGYPKSNHQFIEYLLTQKDTSGQWMQVPRIIYPDQEKIVEYRKSGWKMIPRKPHLNAKIIYLIDGRAISYAESYLGFIEHYKLATIMGQPTAGTNGNVNPFTLPGDYNISWTGMKVIKHDGSQHHGVGILPHVYVEKTIKGVRENRDEFLEKALEIAKSAK